MAKKLLTGYFKDVISISDVIFTPVLGKAEEDFETLLNKKFEMSKNDEVKDEDAVEEENEEGENEERKGGREGGRETEEMGEYIGEERDMGT